MNTYGAFLKAKFGCRVYKVAVDAGFSCPNRDGSKGIGGCIFCDETGSSSRVSENKPIKEQVLQNIRVRKSRYNAKKFIVHFQSFTNTYASTEKLKKLYDEALFTHPDIVGISISTRADSLNEEKVSLIASYKSKITYVNVEIGMQTANDKTLKLINRCETHEDFLNAFALLKKYELDHCIHLILGLPNESKEDMLHTADVLAKLNVNGVKIHLLVAMRNTLLEQLFKEGKWKPLSFEEFTSLCADFLIRLPPSCIIHRLGGNGHPLHIVAPTWVKTQKQQIIPKILLELKKRKTND